MTENQPMRVLVLTAAPRLPDFTHLYQALGRLVEIKLLVLDKSMQRDLRQSIKTENLADYDRVLLDLHFKHIHSQARALAGIRGLLIYEQDACQNYLPDSRWHGAFSRFYRQLPAAKVVVTSASVCSKLQREGFNVHFFPKVYDPADVYFEPRNRDIELGFVGRTASGAYSGRLKMLEQLAREEPLQLLRTEPGEAYREALNRIRFFVSADVGLSEYMAKNFEAMACGCVLLAWRQGGEEATIGLREGDHLLLYGDLAELRAHLKALRQDPELAQRIADAGRAFVEANLTYSHLAGALARLLGEPWPVVAAPTGWRRALSSFDRFLRAPR